MNPSNEEALFALALAKPAEKRPAFLDAVCEGDAALRQRLEALLAAHEQPETLLATQSESARPTIKLDLDDAPDEAVAQTLGRYKLLESYQGLQQHQTSLAPHLNAPRRITESLERLVQLYDAWGKPAPGCRVETETGHVSAGRQGD